MLLGEKGRKELGRKLCKQTSTELGKGAGRRESMQKSSKKARKMQGKGRRYARKIARYEGRMRAIKVPMV